MKKILMFLLLFTFTLGISQKPSVHAEETDKVIISAQESAILTDVDAVIDLNNYVYQHTDQSIHEMKDVSITSFSSDLVIDGTNLRYFKVVDITTEWVTHEVIIHVSGKSYTNGKVGFFMGKVTEESVPTTFNIDDVVIEQVGYREDTVKPIIYGAKDISIEKGTAFDAKAGVYVFDNLSALTVSDIIITGDDFDVNVAGEYTVVYTLKDEQNNEVVVNRKVTVLP